MSAYLVSRRRGHRSWTDEQLRNAVARQRSWRGVARALGLRPTSTLTIRHRAAQMRLDTSHFTGQRPWSDLQLREAVVAGSSWAEVLRILGVTNCGDSLVRVRGHAARLELDVSHLSPPPRPVLPTDLRLLAPRQPMLRVAAASIATAWFTLRGMATAVPVEPQEYDLLVTFPTGVRRVQVKSSTCRTRNKRWKVTVGHRPYTMDKLASRTSYDPDAFEYFFIVTGDGGLYLVPSRALAGRTAVYIDSYPEYRVGDASSLLTWGDG